MLITRSIPARRAFVPSPGEVAPAAPTAAPAPTPRAALNWPRFLGGAAVALLALTVVGRQALGLDWRAIWLRLAAVNPWLLAAAALVFWLTPIVRTARWRRLLAAAGTEPPALPTLLGIYIRGWFANAVTVAQLGDVFRANLVQRAAGIPRATTLGAIVAERLLDLAALAALLAGAALLAFPTQPPRGLWAACASVLIGAVVAAGLVATASRRRWRFERRLPARLREGIEVLTEAFRRSLGALPAAVGLSSAAWLLEGATLALVARAVGAPLGPSAALAAALFGALLTAIPVLPSGLGLTEAGLAVVLLRLGVAADSAAAIVLLARAITYWSVIAVGGALTLARRGH